MSSFTAKFNPPSGGKRETEATPAATQTVFEPNLADVNEDGDIVMPMKNGKTATAVMLSPEMVARYYDMMNEEGNLGRGGTYAAKKRPEAYFSFAMECGHAIPEVVAKEHIKEAAYKAKLATGEKISEEDVPLVVRQNKFMDDVNATARQALGRAFDLRTEKLWPDIRTFLKSTASSLISNESELRDVEGLIETQKKLPEQYEKIETDARKAFIRNAKMPADIGALENARKKNPNAQRRLYLKKKVWTIPDKTYAEQRFDPGTRPSGPSSTMLPFSLEAWPKIVEQMALVKYEYQPPIWKFGKSDGDYKRPMFKANDGKEYPDPTWCPFNRTITGLVSARLMLKFKTMKGHGVLLHLLGPIKIHKFACIQAASLPDGTYTDDCSPEEAKRRLYETKEGAFNPAATDAPAPINYDNNPEAFGEDDAGEDGYDANEQQVLSSAVSSSTAGKRQQM